MKKYIFFLFALMFSESLVGQEIVGQWHGLLKVQGTQLRLVFNVVKTDTGYSATMDSPDQGVKNIPCTKTIFENQKLLIELISAKIEYTAELKNSELKGVYKQRGTEFPLDLSRKVLEPETKKRPQEPIKPYPYYEEEVSFQNQIEGIKLAGTLTLPSKIGKYPVVVLITGSGKQNRDAEIHGHKPFLVISDYLTRNGIGVLRYDDRGADKSEGNFNIATSADFAKDVESAVNYLKTRDDVNLQKIGLVGHSEGGLIAPMVAAKSKDIAFIVLLAGTGIPGDQLLLKQIELVSRANGVPAKDIETTKKANTDIFKMVVESKNDAKLKIDLEKYFRVAFKKDSTAKLPDGVSIDDYIKMQITQIARPWIQYFFRYDPSISLEKVKCPVLALNGVKDLQVPAKENLEAIKTALQKGGNKNVTIKEFANLNHLFQECKTGSPSEYATIEQTFSPLVLEEITAWIKKW